MNLLVAPDLPPSVRDHLAGLIRRYSATETVFGYYPADESAGPRCGRCNHLLHAHLWQLVDPDELEQGGVIDCEVIS